jgi:hypothetical protein
MFKYISEILGNFTQRERISVLIILLFSIIVITVGNTLLKTAKGIPDDTKEYIETIILEKEKLNNDLINAKRMLVDNGIECTNTILNRELEIREEIRKLIQLVKEDANRHRRNEYYPPAPMMWDDTVQISRTVTPVQVDDNPLNHVIKSLEKLEKGLVQKENKN